MQPDEAYLIANLTAIASGQTRGRFAMGGHYARVLLRLYYAPPLHVEFIANEQFGRNLEKFKAWTGMQDFCNTLWMLLDRSSRDLCGMECGRKMALGLFALFDEDIREVANGGRQDC